MSDTINFAPPGGKQHHKQSRGSIEYSSGEVPEQQLSKSTQQPAPEQQRPKKPHSFFTWRKNRQTKLAPAFTPVETTAPQHHKETAVPDLLHGMTSTAAPVMPVQQPQQPQHPQKALPPLQPIRPAAPHLTPKQQKERLVDELPATEVNLIPDTVLGELEKRDPLRGLAYVGLVMVAVILFVYGGLNLYQQKITTDTVLVETDIQSLDQKIAEYKTTQEDAQLVSDRLTSLTEVLQSHVYWTPFLGVVEDLTLPTVYYHSMTGSVSTLTFTFDAVAQSYDQIAPQVAVFRESPYVTNIDVSSAEAFTASSVITADTTATTEAEQGVSFKISVQFAPEIFVHSQFRSYAQE